MAFDVPRILASLTAATMTELKRYLRQANDLNLRVAADAIQKEIIRRRLPTVSADDGASQALRDDCAASLEKSERIEKKRHSYFRKSLASRGCLGAIANVVVHGGPGATRMLEDLRSLGILDCAAESIALRHSSEFGPEVIKTTQKTLNRLKNQHPTLTS